MSYRLSNYCLKQ